MSQTIECTQCGTSVDVDGRGDGWCCGCNRSIVNGVTVDSDDDLEWRESPGMDDTFD